WVLLALAVGVIVASALALRSRAVQDALVSRIARRRIGRNTSALLAPDALRVLLCGTSSPIPSRERAEACTAVFAGGHLWIVDTRFRIAHHGAALLPPERSTMAAMPVVLEGADAARILDEDGVVVTAFAVAHDPVKPAFGYRFDYGGRSVVVSGDTRPCPNLV